MSSLRFAVLSILLLFSTVAFAQHDHSAATPATTAASPSEAQKSFDSLKTLAGSWEGPLSTVPPMKGLEGTKMKVVLRVTSRGNAIMHEMSMTGRPDDPITMLFVDGDRLELRHYCDAGNRPHMVAKPSSDGKTVAFETVDVSGSLAKGHMGDTVFTMIDANHHIEQWTFMFPGQPPVQARFDLQRTKDASGPFNQ